MTTLPQPKSPGSGYTLKYDAWNRLVEVKSGTTAITKNQYDGLNRRIVRDETGGSGDLRHFYYNQQWQVLEERVGTATTAQNQYVYHPYYVDAVLVRFDASSTENYYLHDANFNVIGITDSSANVIERYSYTPYGEATVLDADYSADADGLSDISNELLYTGRRRDPETGLQLNRNRFYASHLGRWVNRDPIGYDGSEWNLYEYVNGMPTYYVDPMGLCQQDVDDWGCPFLMFFAAAIFILSGSFPPKTFSDDGFTKTTLYTSGFLYLSHRRFRDVSGIFPAVRQLLCSERSLKQPVSPGK